MTRRLNSMTRYITGAFIGAAALAALVAGTAQPVRAAAGPHIEIERQTWTFGGLFGHFDNVQLQRGYKVYKEVCASCHSMNLMFFRNLGQRGGPEFPEAVVNQIAAEATVRDGPNDEGQMFERPGRPSDRFPSPFQNEKEAAAAMGGAVPPDLSLITKARTIESGAEWYMFPYVLLRDIVTQYQEDGADYVYALLNGYVDPPEGFELQPGLNYNAVYPGHQIAMANPLVDGVVEYGDGTPETAQQYAKDVTAFLAWAAEPHLEERKQMGIRVAIYLLILSLLLYLSKRALWRNLH
jgi:ubiquinol-cytochrome c reductase cytochrome b/c1 subunit